jgi:mannose-1-phosphate guanylyltransferase
MDAPPRFACKRKRQRRETLTCLKANLSGHKATHVEYETITQRNYMTEAIILCGGAGLRLRPVTGEGPKSMAQVAGSPFLEMPLRQLQRCGVQRVILAVGFGAAAIQSYFGETFCGMEVEYSNESSPLGTGGALQNAAKHVGSSSCLVMNGDSYTDVDLQQVVAAHLESEADVSVVVVPVDERGDVGSVLLDADNNVVEFAEKERALFAQHLNAGIYMLSQETLRGIRPEHPISLERELFPEWIREGRRIKGFVHSGKCVDIGTPERYTAAQDVLAGAENAGQSGMEKECRV